MGYSASLHLTFLYAFALIVIVSSRHIQSSDFETQQDASKSDKPGEYLWYKTDSFRTESRVAKSLIAKASHGSAQNEDSGAIPSQQEEDISGSGESSSEDMENSEMSGSGSYPTSYMVDIHENTGIEPNSTELDGDAALDEHDTSGKEDKVESEEPHEKTAGKIDELTEQATNEQDSSGSAYVEEGSSLKDDSGEEINNNEDDGKLKLVAPVVEKQALNPKRRSDIYRKNKMEKQDDDSEYDKLFKDFGAEGDLNPGLEDEDNDLNDSLNEEETKLLISENDDDTGKSKSEISRPDKDGEGLSHMFRDILDDGSASKPRHIKSHSSMTKEILSKLDSDVFRGNYKEEHVQYHRKKHRHNKLNPHHHDKNKNQTSKEADPSRALSHHADSGIFNGSVSNVTLEAEHQHTLKHHRRHHHQHRRHHDHHRRHHHHHHHQSHDDDDHHHHDQHLHNHQHRHHHHHHRHHHHHHHHHENRIEVQKDIASENKIGLQKPNSSAQYAPQVQSPSIYYPYPAPYPAQQLSPYQSYEQPKSDYEYHSLQNADRQGAVCLDGSTPGYYLKKGTGDGSKKWIIYLEGGAWCETEEACLGRSRMHLGSSLFFKPLVNPGGILSSKKEDNSKFYNWNTAYVHYCDGSSFSGNRSEPLDVEGSLLYFRGFRILDSTISELLSDKDLKQASHVVFSGTSAGGLAVMLHADFVRSKLPRKVRFRTLADSGFFLDTGSRLHRGHRKFRKEMQSVFKLHDCTDGVPQKCVKKMSEKDLWKCIFPQYFLPFVKSKMFIVNPLYDSWQLGHIWEIECASNPYTCTNKEVKQIKKFKKATLKAMDRAFRDKSNIGLFADSCIDHGQVVFTNRWNSIMVKKDVKDWSISSSFIEWLNNPKKETKYLIDDYDYPSNPTCITKGVGKRSDILTEGF